MGGHFDVSDKEYKLELLESKTKEEVFWNDINYANNVTKEISHLKETIKNYKVIKELLINLKELLSINDNELIIEIEKELFDIEIKLNTLEIETLLNGKYDNLNCYLEIHPGAGGTESCDWADMLKRMYLRFCEKNDYTYEIIDEQKGEEAGIKSITILIKGSFPYGYFKGEKGVHRLVRISPFDSNSRRHTSFASVDITPEFDNINDIDIKESDLKIDVYHSSGAGGQSVNTTDSAVRITHLPTKLVVTCQNERSQLKNKEKAMSILKSKLLQLELQMQEEKIKDIKGNMESINFGSQIRSYVLQPYTLVKDSRTSYEVSDALKVLDGDIKEFMIQFLRK